MPFWKQSEDPWDRRPDKAEPREPKENPLDTIKTWNEDRKAKAKEKEEAKRLPPEKCPWCGKEMEQGFVTGGRDAVRWHPGIYKFDPFRGLSGEAIDLLDDGSGLTCYKITWLCRDCKKMVLNMPEPLEDPCAVRLENEAAKEEEESEE